MTPETKQAIINLVLITLVTTLIFTTLALLYGLKHLEERIYWSELQACEQNNANLIDNQNKYLYCQDRITKKNDIIYRTGTKIPSVNETIKI